MDGSVLEEKSAFKMLGLSLFSKLDWGCYIVSIAKTAYKKTGALLFFISINDHTALHGILLSCLA